MSLKQVNTLYVLSLWCKDARRYVFTTMQFLFCNYPPLNFSYFSLYKNSTTLFTKNAFLFLQASKFNFRLLLFRTKLSVFFVINPTIWVDFFQKTPIKSALKSQLLENLFIVWSASWLCRGMRSLGSAPFLLYLRLAPTMLFDYRSFGFASSMVNLYSSDQPFFFVNFFYRKLLSTLRLSHQNREDVKAIDIANLKPAYNLVPVSHNPMYAFISSVLIPTFMSMIGSTYSLFIGQLLK